MRPIAPLLAALIIVFASLAIPSVHAKTTPQKPFSVEDLVRYERVSDPQVSHDGKWVAYNLRQTDMDANKGNTSIWLKSLDNGEPATRFTLADETANTPRWSDSNTLFFMSARSGSNQVWSRKLGSEMPQQVTNLPLDVNTFKLSPDAKQIVVSLSVFTDCPQPVIQCTADRQVASAKDKSSGVLYTQLFVRHWDTWKDHRRNQLFAFELDGIAKGNGVHISKGFDGDIPSTPFGDDSEFAFSPDGQSLIFSGRQPQGEAWSTNFDLYRVASNGKGKPENLTISNLGMDTNPVFSPDGKTLFYLSMEKAGFEADRLRIMRMSLGDKTTAELAPDWDYSPHALSLSSNGEKLRMVADDTGQTKLFELDLNSKSVIALTKEGSVGGYSTANFRTVYSHDTLSSPANLFMIGTKGKPQQMTFHNQQALAGTVFGEYQQFSFKGAENETVYGYVMKPANYQEGKKYPVAFIIHGGPQGSMGNHFHYRWNPQTYAGAGFAVVFIDFHGSTGYGQKFTNSITNDWGGKPLKDLQKGWKYAKANFDFLDGKRSCALGASYGGFMINWIAGNWPDSFNCLVNHDGIFDQRSMYYATEELWFPEWEHNGAYFANPGEHEKHNPANHVINWRTPMLVVHGALDYRVPLEQGLQTFTALQRRGVPSEFLMFPDENHFVLKPANSILWHNTVNNWLKRWTSPE